MPLPRLYTKIIVLISILALLVLVPVVSVLNYQASNNKTEAALISDINPNDSLPAGFNGLLVYANVTSVSSTTVNMHLSIIPNILNTAGEVTPTAFGLIANSKQTLFSALDNAPNADVTFAVLEGGFSTYPFDQYLIAGSIVFFNPTTQAAYDSAVLLVGAVDSWEVVKGSLSNVVPTGPSAVNIEIIFGRSPIAQFFALFLAFLVWLLALSSITASSSIWARGRKVEVPMLAVTGALLFALPSIRNSYPGQPPIGTTLDSASFFWCMLLVAVSFVSLMINYFISTKPESAPKQSSTATV